MSQNSSISDFCRKFWALETKYNLLDLQVRGVKVWQYRRNILYFDISQKMGMFSEHTSPAVPSKGGKENRLINSLWTLNPLLDKEPRDVLVFPHPRKVDLGQGRVDIYTKYLVDEFKEQGVNYQAIERTFDNRLCSQEGQPRRHLEIVEILLAWQQKFRKLTLNTGEQRLIETINKDLNESFGIKIDLAKNFTYAISRFQITYGIMKRIFENKKPKKIFIVVNYGWMAPVTKAAKDLGIEVIELQHGNFSEYHLGYSFPGVTKQLEYFPDQVWVWNDFWKGMCQLPIPSEKISTYSFKHFDHQRRKFDGVKKIENQIVVISQAAIGHKMADVILKNIDRLKDYTIKYKLHPGEYGTWQNNPSLNKLKEYSNVQVIADNKTPLYQFLAESKYLIGVYSTAVFEGLDFGCLLILLNLPGIEYMKNLIKQGKASFVGDDEWIADVIGKAAV